MAGQPNKRRKVQRLTDWANARYSVMPPDAARDPNLTLAHMRLLGELGRVNTQHGWCEFSQKDVAAQMGGVRQTVSAAMNDLVRWRYVEMRDQKQTKSPFCHYRVLIDDPYFEAELEYIERHDHDPDDVSSGDDTPQTGDVSSGDDTPH